ncbi:MAG TPA: class I SAM-dependent methyltransferase [Pyrinomonadaceae bacterium]|nr:class I SAM-dependent methyltransferase [Pyrinomonadaceae bacterium]
MSLIQTLKRAVPLEWKVGFHQYKVLPKYYATRVKNRLEGEPPIPPGDLIYLVAGHRNPEQFLDTGRATNNAIRGLLKKHDLKIEQFGAILDFGCGVGRIMRHWRDTQGPEWHGADYNPELVNWCKTNLKFSDFRVNTLSGELPYAAETFDFIYAFSVFTHLSEPLQFFWINELARVLKPGGYVWFTTHGQHYTITMTPEEKRAFDSGELVVREQQQSGSNFCAVFHPSSYVHERLGKNFDVIDFVPGGQTTDTLHDVHLLRKPLAKGTGNGD